MAARHDLTGKRFGKLTAVEPATNARGRPGWLCRCDCGVVKIFQTSNLKRASTKSCGCSRNFSTGNTTYIVHGMSRTPEYFAWLRMRRSCTKAEYKDYRLYGGRGIKVCDEWMYDFQAFLSHIGKRPGKGYSVDRYPNNNGNYEPGNVRWATQIQQARNKRTCREFTYLGRTMTAVEWAEELGIPYQRMKYRMNRNWTIEKIATTPKLR